ncbi:hypothetical protein BG011_001173 [Mortierella polycephala]|uniref:Uncharacterized protein n=1 Tax=Mortierella polycephala TaxID=41804 RepID=A0A9P6PL36_9FUNG|nr:hypothetical protein BG011_001173 [Mortierella polycephala]
MQLETVAVTAADILSAAEFYKDKANNDNNIHIHIHSKGQGESDITALLHAKDVEAEMLFLEEEDIQEESNMTQDHNTAEIEHANEDTENIHLFEELDDEDHEAIESDESALVAVLEQDTDIVPSLPVIEVLFEETLHELFYPSSEAFKASRQTQQASTRGPLLFPNNESLLEEPLSSLFAHLREDVLVAHYGAEADHYDMGMIFKGLEDLFLLEHEDAASCYSLSKLVSLYTSVSGLQHQEMLLEPFRIELTVQETFVSHITRLENLCRAQVPQQQQLIDASEVTLSNLDDQTDINVDVVTDDMAQKDTLTDLHNDTDIAELEEPRPSSKEGQDAKDEDEKLTAVVQDESLESRESQYDEAVHEGAVESDIEPATAAVAATTATTSEQSHDDDTTIDIGAIDVDSLACFDDKVYDHDLGDEVEDDEGISLRMEIAAHGSPSPTRSPKRTAEELIDLMDDDFVNGLSPDRETFKKSKADN